MVNTASSPARQVIEHVARRDKARVRRPHICSVINETADLVVMPNAKLSQRELVAELVHYGLDRVDT